MIRSISHRGALLGALVGAMLLVTACTPDTTRGRVEQDFAATFSNQYAQSLQLMVKPAKRPRVTSTVCHCGTNLKQDSGPGTWSCEIKYIGADGKRHDDTWVGAGPSRSRTRRPLAARTRATSRAKSSAQ